MPRSTGETRGGLPLEDALPGGQRGGARCLGVGDIDDGHGIRPVGVASAGAFKFDEHEQGALAALDEDSAAEAHLGITAGGRGDRDRRLVDKGAAGGVVAKDVAIASAEAEHPQVIARAAHEAAEVAFEAAAVERRGVSRLDGVIAFADGMNGIAGAGAGGGDEHEAIGGAGGRRGDAGDDAAKDDAAEVERLAFAQADGDRDGRWVLAIGDGAAIAAGGRGAGAAGAGGGAGEHVEVAGAVFLLDGRADALGVGGVEDEAQMPLRVAAGQSAEGVGRAAGGVDRGEGADRLLVDGVAMGAVAGGRGAELDVEPAAGAQASGAAELAVERVELGPHIGGEDRFEAEPGAAGGLGERRAGGAGRGVAAVAAVASAMGGGMASAVVGGMASMHRRGWRHGIGRGWRHGIARGRIGGRLARGERRQSEQQREGIAVHGTPVSDELQPGISIESHAR
jgi:hypothetical protein